MIRRRQLPELEIGGKAYPESNDCRRCGKEPCICDATEAGSRSDIDWPATIMGIVSIVLYVAAFLGTIIGLSYCALQVLD
jgi:hypothetical protein